MKPTVAFWESIETAPKTGQWLLLTGINLKTGYHQVAVGRWNPIWSWWTVPTIHKPANKGLETRWMPSHWAPLPPPPSGMEAIDPDAVVYPTYETETRQ